jgi:hypothetical protein
MSGKRCEIFGMGMFSGVLNLVTTVHTGEEASYVYSCCATWSGYALCTCARLSSMHPCTCRQQRRVGSQKMPLATLMCTGADLNRTLLEAVLE